jgi:hypothetical protein
MAANSRLSLNSGSYTSELNGGNSQQRQMTVSEKLLSCKLHDNLHTQQ